LNVTKKSIVPIRIWNACFVDNSISSKVSSLESALQNYYNAEIFTLEDDPTRATKQINSWVSKSTKRIINQVVENRLLDLMTKPIILVNVVHFKGFWKKKFDPKFTKYEQFNLTETKNLRPYKNIYMMTQTSEFDYYETNEYQAGNTFF
jgi:serpin B